MVALIADSVLDTILTEAKVMTAGEIYTAEQTFETVLTSCGQTMIKIVMRTVSKFFSIILTV